MSDDDKRTRGPTKAQLEADRIEAIRVRHLKDIAFLTDCAQRLGQSIDKAQVEAAQILWRTAAFMKMQEPMAPREFCRWHERARNVACSCIGKCRKVVR